MKKKDVVSGSEYPTNSGDTVIILRYLGCEDVIVTFKDANTPQNFEMKVTMQAIRKGQVRNPYRKTKIVRGGKLVCGVGINDADYLTQSPVNGVRVTCPFYSVWTLMIERCYSKEQEKRYPTYVGCSVIADWLYFMTFREWMMQKDWSGKYLDKDTIVKGNKEYGPDTCAFVSKRVNNFVLDNAKTRGLYPLGVYWNKNAGKFMAQCGDKYLGLFDTQEEASVSYKEAKREQAVELANEQTDNRVKSALLCFVEID